MCEVGSKKKTIRNKLFLLKVQWSTTKEMDYDESYLTLNEKMQPIQWTEWPTSALVAGGSF